MSEKEHQTYERTLITRKKQTGYLDTIYELLPELTVDEMIVLHKKLKQCIIDGEYRNDNEK